MNPLLEPDYSGTTKASTNPLLDWLQGVLSSRDPAAVQQAMQALSQMGGHNDFVERARRDAKNAGPRKELGPQPAVPAILGIRG